MAKQTVSGYSTLQIALHWIIAALVLFQVVFGESMEQFADATEQGKQVTADVAGGASVHYWVGIGVLALVLVRIGLRIMRGAPAHAGNTPAAAAAVAAGLHIAFYVLLVLVPISGLVAYYHLAPVGMLHTLAKPLFVVLIALHAGAALFNQFVRRDGTLMRMLVPGR